MSSVQAHIRRSGCDWEVFLLPGASPFGSAAGVVCSGRDSVGVGPDSSDSEEVAAG